jgi:hypothetical protein
MKISKYARQNWILFALSGFFAWVTWGGLIVSAGRDIMDSPELLVAGVAGLAAVASMIALVIRLWDAD